MHVFYLNTRHIHWLCWHLRQVIWKFRVGCANYTPVRSLILGCDHDLYIRIWAIYMTYHLDMANTCAIMLSITRLWHYQRPLAILGAVRKRHKNIDSRSAIRQKQPLFLSLQDDCATIKDTKSHDTKQGPSTIKIKQWMWKFWSEQSPLKIVYNQRTAHLKPIR